MNAIMFSDLVGPGSVDFLAERLPGLRRDYDADLVIANAENCAVSGSHPRGGFGMTAELVKRLFDGGVDVITSGNHGWDGPDAEAVHGHPRVLRPHNFPEGTLGKGVATLEAGGEKVSVVGL